MSSFGGSSSSYGGSSSSYGSPPPPPTGGMSGAQKQQQMAAIQQQVQMTQFTELLQKMSETCFNKCVTKPGTSLSNSEQSCLAKCMDRYMESMEVVSKSYVKRLQSQGGQ